MNTGSVESLVSQEIGRLNVKETPDGLKEDWIDQQLYIQNMVGGDHFLIPVGLHLPTSVPSVTEIVSKKISTFLSGSNMEITDHILSANVPFWVQGFLRNPYFKPRVWNPDTERIFGANPKAHIPISIGTEALFSLADTLENLEFTRSLFSHAKMDRLIWSRFVENFQELAIQFQEEKENFHDSLEESNLIIVSNHLTWANLPFLAFCIHYFWGVPKNNIYTLVGPAIPTGGFELASIQRFSNVITTWPQTERAQTGFPGADAVRKGAVRSVLNILKPTSWDTKVLLMAPSGTKDERDESGEVILRTPSDSTVHLLDRMAGSAKVIPIGVNDAGIIDPHGNPKKGSVYVGIGGTHEMAGAIARLPGLVRGEDGQSIARWSTQPYF